MNAEQRLRDVATRLKLNLSCFERGIGDVSSRRYYRSSQLKGKLLCVDSLESKSIQNFVAISRFFDAKDIPCPRIYDFNIKEGYLIQEDLGDGLLKSKISDSTSKGDLLEKLIPCVDIIVKLQTLDWSELKEYPIQNNLFDTNKLMQEVEMTLKYFVERKLKCNQRKVIEAIRESMYQVCEEMSQETNIFCHRDFHLQNVIEFKGQLYLIDYQDARLGNRCYDLSSLLYDRCADYEVQMELVREELKSYFGDKTGIEVGREFELTCIQRMFKVLGSFAYAYLELSNSDYLKYIKTTFDDLVKKCESEGLSVLKKNLIKVYDEA